MLQGGHASVRVYHRHDENDEVAQSRNGFVRVIRGQEFDELGQSLDLGRFHAEITGKKKDRYAKCTVELGGRACVVLRVEGGIQDCGRGGPSGLHTRDSSLVVCALPCYGYERDRPAGPAGANDLDLYSGVCGQSIQALHDFGVGQQFRGCRLRRRPGDAFQCVRKIARRLRRFCGHRASPPRSPIA